MKASIVIAFAAASFAFLGIGAILLDLREMPEHGITVIDGDTVERHGVRYRLLDYDTPEIKGKCPAEREAALKAKTYLIALIDGAKAIDLVSAKRQDIYGRTLAWLFIDGQEVSSIMIGDRYAREYHGGRRKGWCN